MGNINQADITGMTLKMNNGQFATVIEYRDSKHMTIKFEDGTIKSDVYKVHFLAGKVSNPSLGDSHAGSAYTLKNKSSIVGLEVMQNCGQKATCINYAGTKDIDVQFEDGTVVRHKYKYAFLHGNINNPNVIKGSILGMKLKMNCGMYATVIEDKGCENITVRFENGDIVKNRRRIDFKMGEIACPSLTKYYAARKIFEGDTRLMNCGQTARIICYRNSDDIDIEFEDGTIVENKTVTNFKLGNIKNPNYNQYDLTGETLMMNCGMECTVIEHINVSDITVKFEDGTVVYHKTKHEFHNRTIQNPNIPRFNSLPQAIVFYYIKKYFKDALCDYRPDWLKNKKTNNNLEIDIWIPSKNIGIEYDGYIPRHTECTWRGMQKLEAIESCEHIKRLIVINEATTYIYDGKKLIHYRLINKSSRECYKDLIIELYNVIISILNDLNIKNISISPYDIDYNFDSFNYARFLSNLREKFKADGIVI